MLRASVFMCVVAAAIAAAIPAMALAQDEIPPWVRNYASLWGEGLITDAEFFTMLQYLVEVGILTMPETGSAGSNPELEARISQLEAQLSESYEARIHDQGDFITVYQPTPRYLSPELVSDLRGMLNDEVEWLNANFLLPHDVKIMMKECEEVNAFYIPSEKRIEICYEYIAYTMQLWSDYSHFLYDDLTEEDLHRFVHDVTTHTFFHELGHALVDVYNLPITGLEENAVDQFATLMVLEYTGGQHVMKSATENYLYRIQEDYQPDYSDTHALDKQRFHNFQCWQYGADPEYNEYLVLEGWLPETRAGWCEREFEKIIQSWSFLLRDYTGGLFAERPDTVTTGTIQVEIKDTLIIGELIEMRGSDASPSGKVYIDIFDKDGTNVESLTTTPTKEGIFVTYWKVPSDLEPGRYEVFVRDILENWGFAEVQLR